MRRARSLPLNNALHHWARIAVLRDPRAKEHYDQLRQSTFLELTSRSVRCTWSRATMAFPRRPG
jgi:hypothetical protein